MCHCILSSTQIKGFSLYHIGIADVRCIQRSPPISPLGGLTLTCEMSCNKRRGARSVSADAWPREPKRVRQAAQQEKGRCCRCCCWLLWPTAPAVARPPRTHAPTCSQCTRLPGLLHHPRVHLLMLQSAPPAMHCIKGWANIEFDRRTPVNW